MPTDDPTLPPRPPDDHPAASPDFWHARWTSDQIGFHEGQPNRYLRRFWPGLGARGRVLVPLCGKSHDLGWVAEQGHDVVGVELSPVACAAFFAERGEVPTVSAAGRHTRYVHDRITLLQGDIFDLEGDFDALWDRAALIALPAPVRVRYAALVRARVRGPKLVVTFVYDQARRDGPPFSVPDAELLELHPGARLVHRETLDEERWRPVGTVEEAVWVV